MSAPRAYGLEWDEAEVDLAGWQGIAALGFTGPAIPGGDAVVRIQLVKAASGLGPADVEVVAPDGSALDRSVTAFADGVSQIEVTFPAPHPRGTTTMRLVSGGDDPLHPFFAAASFDFFIDCPAGDCRALAGSDGPAPSAEPAIDLTTKDYAGFVRVAQDWALATDSNWSDLEPASTEQTLLELVAHHAEMLSLHQDRVLQEAFIDTARERLSIRRHAAFLGLALDEGASASVVVAIDIAPGVGQSGFLPEGTQLLRREERGQIANTFVTASEILVDRRWNGGLSDAADRGDLRPAAWPGAPDATLPVGTTSLLLLGHGLGLTAGQRVALIQGTDAHVGTLVSVDEFAAEGWTDDPANPPGLGMREVSLIAWEESTTVQFSPWIEPVAQPFLVTANLVDAIHGEPRRASNVVEDGVIPLGGLRRDVVQTTDRATGEAQLRALRTPESGILVAADGRPALTLAIDGEVWDWQPDLWTSAGFDRHYTTERDEDGAVWLVFGDGRRGQAVPLPPGTGAEGLGLGPGGAIEVAYLRGQAEEGNLGAFALNDMLPPNGADQPVVDSLAALNIRAITNILPATGGRQAVPLDTARQLIPESIRHPDRERCVTADDYARAAEDVIGIAQAAAKPLGGLFNTIAILCAPDEGDDLSEALRDDVFAHLDRLRMAGREHRVRAPDYVPLDIALLICPAGHNVGAAALRSAVRTALAPGTARAPGFFNRSRTRFGDEIRLADILAAVQERPEVGAVRALAFRPLFDAGGDEIRRAIRFAPTEIAQFRAEEAHPERGRLTIRIEGVDPPSPPDAFVTGGPAPEPAVSGVTP